MIPNTIHFIWTTTNAPRAKDPIPDEVQRQFIAWSKSAPDCTLRVWSWTDFEDLMSADAKGRGILDLTRSCRLPAMRADLMRLAIVSRAGGIWSAVKNRPRTSLRGRLPLHVPLFIAEHWPIPQKPVTTGFYCNHFFGAVPDHPFINAALDFALAKVATRATDDSIAGLTGGGVFTRIAKRGTHGQPHAINSKTCWQDWLQRVGMEYNKGGKHWSERQKTEPLYA